MRRRSLALFVLALSGWLGAVASQVVALRADGEERSSTWTLTRDRFLLLSSICMNTLVLSAVYRLARRLVEGARKR